MRFTFAALTGALAALASAQNPFNIPDGGLVASVGVPVTLSWEPTTSGTVSLLLRDGPNANLNPGIQLVSGMPNTGSFTFTPTAANSVANVAYTIEIISDTDPNLFNFSPRFYINTGSAAPTPAPTAIAENSDGGSRLKSRQNSAVNFALVASEAFAVAEEATEMGSGSGAGRVKVCGGVLVLLGCFFVVLM